MQNLLCLRHLHVGLNTNKHMAGEYHQTTEALQYIRFSGASECMLLKQSHLQFNEADLSFIKKLSRKFSSGGKHDQCKLKWSISTEINKDRY